MQNLSVTALSGLALIAAGIIGPSETFAQGAETTQVLKSELQGETGREANIVVFEVEPGWETVRDRLPVLDHLMGEIWRIPEDRRPGPSANATMPRRAGGSAIG